MPGSEPVHGFVNMFALPAAAGNVMAGWPALLADNVVRVE
jgi:hypothetical protein